MGKISIAKGYFSQKSLLNAIGAVVARTTLVRTASFNASFKLLVPNDSVNHSKVLVMILYFHNLKDK